MSIDRTGKSGPTQPEPRRAEQATRGERLSGSGAEPRSSAPSQRADVVALSAEALALANGVPKGSIPAARLKEIAQRMESGHYDRPDVLDQISRRILAELDRTATE